MKKNDKKIIRLKKDREDAIKTAFVDKVKNQYKTNDLVDFFHPKKMKIKIEQIINETYDTKTFRIKRVDNLNLPPFKAGQYIVLKVVINGIPYKRAYSISSSPKDTNMYDITIKRVKNGIVSNYLLKEIKEGDTLEIEGPFGDFYYEPLRDEPNVIALVGGSGITPIMSMARAINDNILPINLTIFYADEKESSLIFKEELDNLNSKNEAIKVEYILKDEANSLYETGLIDKSKIEEYAKDNYSYFVCGPTGFYKYLNIIFKELDIPNKYIRHDIFKPLIDEIHHIEHELTIKTDGKEIKIPCYEDETLAYTMEKNKISFPRSCLVGECGYCLSKLESGEVKTNTEHLRKIEQDQNYLHPCESYPLTDVTIKLSK